MVPIAYASSEGSDEPAHPRKIARALTAHIHNEAPTLLTAKISLRTAQSYQHLCF